MNPEKIDIEKIITHWKSRSDQDFDTLHNLYKTKDYHWALFIGHLVIERLLKALIVKKTGKHAPFTHDLRRLAVLADLELNEEYKRYFDTITTFNMNARYDDYKKDFYKKCTAEYAFVWISNIETLRGWIKEML